MVEGVLLKNFSIISQEQSFIHFLYISVMNYKYWTGPTVWVRLRAVGFLLTLREYLFKKKKKKKPWLITIVYRGKNKGMFGNYFFPLIFCFQKQFSIFETKKLVW